MTDVIATILGASQAGSLVVIVWLVYKVVTKTEAHADAQIACNTAVERVAEANFKLQQVQTALTRELQLNESQAAELQKAINVPDPQNEQDAANGNLHAVVTRVLSQLSKAN